MARSRSAVSGLTLVAAQRSMRWRTPRRRRRRLRSAARPSRTRPRRAAPRHRCCRGSGAGGPPRRSGVRSSRTRGEVDQREALRRRIGEGVAGSAQHLGGAAQLVGGEIVEEGFDRPAAFLGVEAALGDRDAVAADGERCRCSRRSGCASSASRSFRISIRKAILGRCVGAAGSKPEGPFSIA